MTTKSAVEVPAVSIVVVTRAPSLMLARLLRSLGRAHEVDSAELLIGLNGSDDVRSTRALAERYLPSAETRIVRLPRTSPAEARNDVVRDARAPVLLFLDDDVEVRPDLLAQTREIMKDESVAVAGGPNLTPPAAPAFEQLAGEVLGSALGAGPVRKRYRAEPPGAGSERSLILCNLAVRRTAFVGFAGDLLCAEENELLAQLARAGARMVYHPGLAVYHHRRKSLRSHLRQMAKYGFGRGQVLVRTLGATRVVHVLPALTLLCILAAAALNASILAIVVAAYAAVLAAGSIRLGGKRRGATALALLLATHFGYVLGALAGLAYEARQAARRLLAAGEGRLGRDSAATFLALMLAIVGGVGAGAVIARSLGPEGRGLFELGRLLAVSIAFPAGFGLGRAAVFFRPRKLITDAGVFGAVLGALAGGALAGAALAAVLLATGWHGLGHDGIALVCGSVPLIAFFMQGQSALQGIGQAAWFRRTLALRESVFLVVLAAVFIAQASVIAALAAWFVHWLISALWVGRLLARNCGRPQFPSGLRRLVVYGTSQAAVVFIMQAHLRLDAFVVQGVKGTAELGLYAVAFGLAELIVYGGRAVGLSLFPRTAASSAGDPAGGARRTARTLRVVLLLALGGAAVLAAVGPALIDLVFGSRFAEAGQPLRALLPGTVALALFVILQNDLSGRGRIRAVAASGAGAVAANIALNLLLVPRFGATGAAFASSVTYTAAATALLVVFSRATGVSLRDCLVPHGRDAEAAARSIFGKQPRATMSGAR